MDTQEGNTIPDATEEIWKDIPGFLGYQVSDMGRVRSFWRSKGAALGTQGEIPGGKFIATTPQRILVGGINRGGYHRVTLRKHGRNYSTTTHTLVLETFVGPRPTKKMQSCHNNGIRSDNRLTNLRWDTCKNNQGDRRTHGTAPIGEKNNSARLTATQVIQIRTLYAQGGYLQVELGRMFNVTQSMIGNIVHRSNWTHLP